MYRESYKYICICRDKGSTRCRNPQVEVWVDHLRSEIRAFWKLAELSGSWSLGTILPSESHDSLQKTCIDSRGLSSVSNRSPISRTAVSLKNHSPRLTNAYSVALSTRHFHNTPSIILVNSLSLRWGQGSHPRIDLQDRQWIDVNKLIWQRETSISTSATFPLE
jgi:hypothetical protein